MAKTVKKLVLKKTSSIKSSSKKVIVKKAIKSSSKKPVATKIVAKNTKAIKAPVGKVSAAVSKTVASKSKAAALPEESVENVYTRKIAVINHKGGVGKTTTTITLGAGLSRKGKKVLILDLDAQGSIGTCLNAHGVKDMYDFLVNNSDYRECVVRLGENLDIITSKKNLVKAELYLQNESDKEFILKQRVATIKGYDYILFDCAPSLGLMSQNALIAADEAIIPTATDVLGYKALKDIISSMNEIQRLFGHQCRVRKILPTFYDPRMRICKEMLEKIMNDYYELVADPICVCAKMKEAPKSGMSIFKFAPESSSAKDYMRLVTMIAREDEHAGPVPLARAKMAAIACLF